MAIAPIPGTVEEEFIAAHNSLVRTTSSVQRIVSELSVAPYFRITVVRGANRTLSCTRCYLPHFHFLFESLLGLVTEQSAIYSNRERVTKVIPTMEAIVHVVLDALLPRRIIRCNATTLHLLVGLVVGEAALGGFLARFE